MCIKYELQHNQQLEAGKNMRNRRSIFQQQMDALHCLTEKA